jgi:hypothetical protein
MDHLHIRRPTLIFQYRRMSMMIKRTNGMTLPFSVSSPNDSSDVARQVGVIYLLSLSALLRSSNRYTVGCDGGDDSSVLK